MALAMMPEYVHIVFEHNATLWRNRSVYLLRNLDGVQRRQVDPAHTT